MRSKNVSSARKLPWKIDPGSVENGRQQRWCCHESRDLLLADEPQEFRGVKDQGIGNDHRRRSKHDSPNAASEVGIKVVRFSHMFV